MKLLNQKYEEAVLISTLIPHPQNPNKGDVSAISESIEANGFYEEG
jgi:hypothetical protein